MAQLTTSTSVGDSSPVYTPPLLPEYLKNVFDLKPIVGTPNDTEMKGIHAVIRVAAHMSQVPSLFNPELSMNLAQHLFDAQMARYRSKYSQSVSPRDNVYTPPVLPSAITVALKPVVGIPSDEEIQSIHAVIYSWEHLKHIPAMFDPDLDMILSQHLFDVQMARYMQRSMHGQFVPKNRQPQLTDESVFAPRPQAVTGHEPPGLAKPIEAMEGASTPLNSGPASIPVHQPNMSTCADAMELITAGQEESSRQLENIADLLKNINRVLLATQYSVIRASGDHYWSRFSRTPTHQHELVNEQGMFPLACGLPPIVWDYITGKPTPVPKLTERQLSQYLSFYKIGDDLVKQAGSGEPEIKPGKRDEAGQLLWKFLFKERP